MSGLEKILEHIANEGKRQAEDVMRRAEAEAQRLKAQAAEEAAASEQAWHEKAKQEAERVGRRVRSDGRMAAAQTLLRERQSLLSQCFAKAHESLLAMPSAEYEELLCDLIAAAADGTERLVLCRCDRDRLRRERLMMQVNRRLKQEGGTARLALDEATVEADGGFLLQKGDVTVDCTFSVLLAEQRTKLGGILSDILEKEWEPCT